MFIRARPFLYLYLTFTLPLPQPFDPTRLTSTSHALFCFNKIPPHPLFTSPLSSPSLPPFPLLFLAPSAVPSVCQTNFYIIMPPPPVGCRVPPQVLSTQVAAAPHCVAAAALLFCRLRRRDALQVPPTASGDRSKGLAAPGTQRAALPEARSLRHGRPSYSLSNWPKGP